MKIIFLDIDGVLLPGEVLWSDECTSRKYICPKRTKMLLEVQRRTDAIIVVSSTWRVNHWCKEFLEAHGFILHDDWKTDNERGYEHSLLGYQNNIRGSQIQRWLDMHWVDKYVILDDDDDMLHWQVHVQTEFETGLTSDHCRFIEEFFND